MNKTQEALELAIEALELINEHAFRCGLAQDAIKACKEALAELSIQWMEKNAKELGLDYCKHGSDSACKECYMEKSRAELAEKEPVTINPLDGQMQVVTLSKDLTEQATIVTQIDAVKFQEALDAMCVDKDAKIAELQAHLEELRKALEGVSAFLGMYDMKNKPPHSIVAKALAQTPAQSLQAFENEVIERCAKEIKSFKQADPYTGEALATSFNTLLNECIEAIRELKGKQNG